MTSPHRVVLALTSGMPIFEASVPCEVFGIDRPDLASPWYSFSVVGLGDGPVRIGPGFYVPQAHGSDELANADTLVVPACSDVHDNPPPQLVDAVRAAHKRGSRLVSICSGAFILAAAGVLDGRRATTHWMHAAELARRYPAVHVDPDVLYVDEGDVITSAGTAAGIDACLHVVRADHGAAVAAELGRRLVTPPHRQGGQAQYARGTATTDDDWLGPLMDWVNARLDAPLTVASLAAQASVSVRTLERRFTLSLGDPPLRWLLLQRVRRAQEMLERTSTPVETVAAACGFGTATNMRAHFNKYAGVPPTTYRRTFQSPRAGQPALSPAGMHRRAGR
jgi:AraC family transcriptional regulator, transcriptional activator FtrA